MTIQMKDIKVVTVKFLEESTKEYSYKTHLPLVEDDLVVVPSSGQSINFGFSVARVSQTEGLTDYQTRKANKYIACKIDLDEYHKQVEAEKIVQELYNKLDQRVKEAQRVAVYKSLAGSDPEMKALLERLAEFDSSVGNLLEAPKD